MYLSNHKTELNQRITAERRSELATFAVVVATMQPGACEIMIEMVDHTSPLEWGVFKRFLDRAEFQLEAKRAAGERAKLFSGSQE